MKIKRKLSLGLFFLFSVITLLIVLGSVYIIRFSDESKKILKDNYLSLEYAEGMLKALDAGNPEQFEKSLVLQEANVTELYEDALTRNARTEFENWKKDPHNSSTILLLRNFLYQIAEVNRLAIVRKSDAAQKTAQEATVWIGIVGGICFIISFTLIVNFPGYIANPIAQLTESIKAIANRKYEERLYFESKDEFGELADAFNSMSSKLEEYENSNLAKLLSEKKRIETLINRMHHPTIGLDETGVILFVNKEAEEILGVKAADLTGRKAVEAASTNDLLRTLTRNLNLKEEDPVTLKIYSHGRESFYTKEIVRVTSVPTGEKEERFIGHVILLNDITEFKERDLAKTNFLATVSHELKTPIASLQMCLKLLQDMRVGPINAEQQNIIKTAGEETVRLSKITNELLDLAQVESGNIKLKTEKVDPTDIINFGSEAVKFQAERKHIVIETELNDHHPKIMADMDKTSWVLINLLTNAIRYSPENAKIIIRVQAQKDKVRFEVQDFGMGISEKHLPRLFDRFYQVPGTSSGTGLGLAISKEFIEAQGGEIGVSSEEGKGSLFYFSLNAQAT